MKIKKLKLENIRSYVSQEIGFPDGSLLLSGDIGSGKSTILLAVDFALFGLAKGSNNGSGLLRNGEDKGKVELHLEIDDKNIVITRNLRRMNGVNQDSGSLAINGHEKKMTVVEMKQAILEMLNYPKELLTKSKSLIYRYTVYTPQEEMKSILLEGNELRLDTLRKVFGVDKYKRIRDNAKIMMGALRDRKKELAGFVIDLEDKRKQAGEMSVRMIDAKRQVEGMQNELGKVNKEIMYKKEWLNKLENDAKMFREMENKLAVNKVRLQNARRRIEDAMNDAKMYDEQINLLKRKMLIDDVVKHEKELEAKNNGVMHLNNILMQLNSKVAEYNALINSGNESKARFMEISKCPVCMQDVNDAHKNSIIKQIDSQIDEHNQISGKHMHQLKDVEKQLAEFRKNAEEINYMITEHRIIVNSVNDKVNGKQRCIQMMNDAEEEISRLTAEEKILADNIAGYKDADSLFRKEREMMDVLLDSQRTMIGRHSALNADARMIDEMLLRLNEEIARKEDTNLKIAKLDSVKAWIDEDFVELLEAIEKNVMLRIYGEFDAMFRKWADILLADSNVRLRLDEAFTPKIEQNGYDIEYEYLSGGEKTAVALAYRLALNQVINSIISQIKTRDLIILDEPTDGFSDEQLDRMRDVLAELNVRQLIIVSHESKIESFVQHVTRLRKDEHITRIVQ